jgi:hypothetical protein
MVSKRPSQAALEGEPTGPSESVVRDSHTELSDGGLAIYDPESEDAWVKASVHVDRGDVR